MKKFISAIISLTLLLALFPVQLVGAVGVPTITVGAVTVDVSDGEKEIWLPIHVKNNPGIAGITWYVTIPDGWAITAFDYADEDFVEGSIFTTEGRRGPQFNAHDEHNVAEGKFNIGSTDAVTADGVVTWVVFAVPETAQGVYEIKIEDCEKICGIDTEVNKTNAFTFESGSVIINETYTVEYYQQKADGTGYAIVENEHLKAPAGTIVTAESKTFAGFTENTAMGNPSGTVTADDSLVLSRYYDRNSYTITFNSNGGSDVDPITALYGAEVAAPEAPVLGDYDFAGWFVDEELTKPFTFDTMPLNGAELYAKWMEKPPVPYTVRYYHQLTNGSGYAVAEEIQLEAKRNTTVTAPEKAFEGLTLNTKLGDCTGVVTADGGLILSRYYERNEYSIVFDTKGGSEVPAITARYGEVVSAPSAPLHEQKTFGGWYADEALTIPYTFGTMPLNGAKVYAKWLDDSKNEGRGLEYKINGIQFRDMSTQKLVDKIPVGAFFAEVNVTNLSSDQMDVVVLVSYAKNGKMLDIDCLYANPSVGDTVIFAGAIDNQDGKVAKVQAMVLSSLTTQATALAQAVSR